MQAYQRKTEKFFVSEEKKFGRIDSVSLKIRGRYVPSFWTENSEFALKSPFLTRKLLIWTTFPNVNKRIHR